MVEINEPIALTNQRGAQFGPMRKGGRPKGTTGTFNLHSKHPSSIAMRLKSAGVDWVASFAIAIKTNDKDLLSLWVKILPYLIVTQGHHKIKRGKGNASKHALEALAELEGR